MVKHRFIFRTASSPFMTPILCMWSNYGIIRPYAKYRPKISSFGRRFGHLVRPQSCLGAHRMIKRRFLFFSNVFSPVRDADTLHVVGSYHDPTPCKVSAQNLLFLLSRVFPDAMVMVVGISCSIQMIRLGFVHEMFFSNF
jgi:hypothetical protein